MYELDYMLDGEASRQHHQDMIQEVQQERYARKIAALQNNQNTSGIIGRLRAIFTAVIYTITG